VDKGDDRKSGQERKIPEIVHALYAKETADALEADLQPLAASGLITRLSKYDTNPANNPQPPEAPGKQA